MGDVLTLIEKAQEAFDGDEAVDMAASRCVRATSFTLEDFLEPDAAR